MSKPKVAILFTGLMRMYQASDAVWLKFLENNDVDVFVHTWWQKDYALLSKMLKTYKPVSYQIDEPLDLDESPYLPRVHQGVSVYNVLSMWHGIKRGYQMMASYYASAGYQPAVVIKTRFDLMVDDMMMDLRQPLVINIEPNKEPVCIHYKKQLLLPQADVLAYGNMAGMRAYSNTIDFVPHIYERSDFKFTSEHVLASSLCEQKFPFINQVGSIKIIRA